MLEPLKFRNLFIPLFLASLLGGLFSAAFTIAITKYWPVNNPGFSQTASLPAVQTHDQTGMEIVDGYRCNQVERKISLINGIEDNFALSGVEPASLHARLDDLPYYEFIKQNLRDYDEKGDDRDLIDFFEVPSNISKGIFIIKLDLSVDHDNDSLIIGDLAFESYERKTHFVSRIPQLLSNAKWKQNGLVYHIDLADLIVKNPHVNGTSTMFDFIRSADGKRIVDIQVSDDTAVDFAAIVACEKPGEDRGVTMLQYSDRPNPIDNISHLTCRGGAKFSPCNPKSGDTKCDIELPVACFHDLRASLPDNLRDEPAVAHFWSGGELAYSKPVQGFDFETVNDVNRFCAQSFGQDWRVANWHDGGGSEIAALGDIQSDQRVWVDIKDQPYGTCWKRDHLQSEEASP